MAAPQKTYAFVSASKPQEMIVLEFESGTGALTERQRSAIPADTEAVGGGGQPIAFSPDKRFLYVALRQVPYPVVTYSVDSEGSLTAIGSCDIAERPAYMMTDRTGRFLFSVSYAAGVLTVGPIGVDGVAGPAAQVIRTPPQAHGVAVSPDNKQVYVASMAGDVVQAYGFDAASGRLDPEPFQNAASAPGAGPRHIVLSADGRFLYCITEHHGSVIAFGRDAASGRLTALQTISMLPNGILNPQYVDVPRDPPGAADIRISADGKFLYASDRVTNTIGVFGIEISSGRLTPMRSNVVESTPRSFALDADSPHLFCLGVWEGVIGVYAIDAANGTLTRRSQLKLSETVDWVEVVDLP